MSTVQDLMGLGMPAPLAARLGNTPDVKTLAANSDQASAYVVQQHVTVISVATTTANSIKFATGASLGAPFYVVNNLAATVTGVVYCPVSGTMNGTANGSVSLTTGKTAIFQQTAQSVWVSFPLAP